MVSVLTLRMPKSRYTKLRPWIDSESSEGLPTREDERPSIGARRFKVASFDKD
jgi:hypothetical protein